MYSALALLCLLAPSVLDAAWAPGLRVRFNETSSGVGKDSFIPLPLDVKAAESSGWAIVPRPESPKEYASLVLRCPKDDHTVCALYDDTGNVAGMQIGLDHETYHDFVFDMLTIGFTKWTAKVNGKPRNYWTLQQYYLSGEKLATDSAARVASRDPTKIIQGSHIYVSGPNGRVDKISTNLKHLDGSMFKKQNCIDGMGTHYYHNMTSKFVCADGNMYPWFVLAHDGQVVGLGLLTYGLKTVKEGQRDWFENFKRITIGSVLREKVQCLWDLSGKDQMLTMHTYFVDKPYDIKC